jgi:hypothetical protein
VYASRKDVDNSADGLLRFLRRPCEVKSNPL